MKQKTARLIICAEIIALSILIIIFVINSIIQLRDTAKLTLNKLSEEYHELELTGYSKGFQYIARNSYINILWTTSSIFLTIMLVIGYCGIYLPLGLIAWLIKEVRRE